MTEKVLMQPASESAERAVLGCIFLDPQAINTAAETIRSEDFYFPKNQMVYRAMLSLSSRHEPIDYATVEEQLRRDGNLDKVGGAGYLLDINEGVEFYLSNLRAYLDIIHEKSERRALIKIGEALRNRGYDPAEAVEDVSASAEQGLIELKRNSLNEGLVRIQETLSEALERVTRMSASDGSLTGLTTGFRDLDNALSGLQRSDLVLLAARPSMGKTALGVNMAYNAARYKDAEGNHPYKVAIFSLEMSKLQLNQRLLSMASGLNLQDIISGQIDDWERLLNGFDRLNELPIYIDDTSSISIQELRSKCRQMAMETGLDLIVIDYLQLMTVDDMRANENRQQEISTISRNLKALAKELNCPVLALSQLSRKAESRQEARPMMSDMRESGAIEQDADVVMLIYREDYYNKDTEQQNITDVIIAKHRNGPTGTVQLYFKKEQTKFGDLSYDTDPTV